MNAFSDFESKYGAGEICAKVDARIMVAYSSKIPSSMLELWDRRGWCSYDNGFIWLTNPDDYVEILADWIDPNDGYVVVGRTAFADLFLWQKNGFHVLHTQYGKIAPLGRRITSFFNFSLCDQEYVDDALDRPLFIQALSEFGELKSDECYAFNPVLALGGEANIGSLKKAKVREYLGILAQIVIN